MEDEKDLGQQDSVCIVGEADRLEQKLHDEAQDMILRGDLVLRHPRVYTITTYDDEEAEPRGRWSHPHKVTITSDEWGPIVEIYEHKRTPSEKPTS